MGGNSDHPSSPLTLSESRPELVEGRDESKGERAVHEELVEGRAQADPRLHDFIDIRRDLVIVREPGDAITRFDREGRWFYAQRGDQSWRRGLDGRVKLQPRVKRRGPRERDVRWLERNEIDALAAQYHRDAAEAFARFRAGEKKLFRAVSDAERDGAFAAVERWSPGEYAADEARFREVYGEIPILPPDQYLSLYLHPVRGCSYNRCLFCTFYRDREFRILSDEEWMAHCVRVRDFFGRSLSLRHGIFLGDANALAVPHDRLAEMIDAMRAVFPASGGLENITAFLDTFSRTERSAEKLAGLRARGLHRVYIGLETGHDPLRRLIAKPGSAAEALECIRELKASGISVGLMVLLGVGGSKFAEPHLRETLELLFKCGLDAKDIVFLSRIETAADSEYAATLKREEWGALTEEDLEAQESAFRAALPRPIHVGEYDIRKFVY